MPTYDPISNLPLALATGGPLDAEGQDCDKCCDNTNYYRTIDCCTETESNYVVSTGVNGKLIKAHGRCYIVDKTVSVVPVNPMTLADVLSEGKQVISTYQVLQNDEEFPFHGCNDDTNCNALFITASRVCWDTGDAGPHTGLFGICTTSLRFVSEWWPTIMDKWFTYGGYWWRTGTWYAISLCNVESFIAELGADLIDACPTTFVAPDLTVCCHLYQEPDYGPLHSCEVPCTITVATPGNFTCDPSWCSATNIPWDGVCVTDGFIYAGVGGTLPGTSYCNAGIQITWNWTTSKWELNLHDGGGGYYWTGDGPSDPCEPRGTYTFVARYGLTGPGCSSNTAGGYPTQTGTGPTTITVS